MAGFVMKRRYTRKKKVIIAPPKRKKGRTKQNIEQLFKK